MAQTGVQSRLTQGFRAITKPWVSCQRSDPHVLGVGRISAA